MIDLISIKSVITIELIFGKMSFGTRYNKYIFAQNCTRLALLLFIRLSTDLRHVDRLRVEAVHQLAEHHAVPEQEGEVVGAGGRGEARVAGRHHLELVQPPQALLPQRLHVWAG